MIDQGTLMNKQRILYIGANSQALLKLTSSVFKTINKLHDVITTSDEIITDAPLVLIDNKALQAAHHILVVGEDITNLEELQKWCDATPKSGSIVFNAENKEVKKICAKERVDVIQLPYKPSKSKFSKKIDELAAIEQLLTRLRVPKDQFEKAITTL